MPTDHLRAVAAPDQAVEHSYLTPSAANNPQARWRSLPLQTVANTAMLTGRSPAHVYFLLKLGELHAVKLGGKTLVKTESVIKYLARAKPWRADTRRVAAANERRVEIAEK